MSKYLEDKLLKEHKMITKCIFDGLTNAEIAKKLNYSQSTISNRLNSLFEKYSAKSRFEFVLGVFSEISRQNRNEVEKRNLEISFLTESNRKLKTILTKIIQNKNNKNALNVWIKNGEKCIKI